MANHKETKIPKSTLSFAWFLFKTWWALVPVGIASAYGTITFYIKTWGSAEQKAWWDGLSAPSRLGWQTLVVVVFVSLMLVFVGRLHLMVLSLEEEISDLRKREKSEPFLGLLHEKQRLEEEIAILEKKLPENIGVTIRPAVKIGKSEEDYLREELARKKENLKAVVDQIGR